MYLADGCVHRCMCVCVERQMDSLQMSSKSASDGQTATSSLARPVYFSDNRVAGDVTELLGVDIASDKTVAWSLSF